MSYVGSVDKSVSCIYGTFNIKVGEEVPMLYAVKFPQFVTRIQDPIVEVPEEIIEVPEVKIKERKGKTNEN